jgi:hypothetical protein
MNFVGAPKDTVELGAMLNFANALAGSPLQLPRRHHQRSRLRLMRDVEKSLASPAKGQNGVIAAVNTLPSNSLLC